MRYLSFLFVAILLHSQELMAFESRFGKDEDNIIIMREVTVEGEVDRPAMIIVPRARLLEREMFNKSYFSDIIQDIYFRPFQRIEPLDTTSKGLKKSRR